MPPGIRFTNPNARLLDRHVRSCAARALPFVQEGAHAGRRAIITGSGPSLLVPEHLEMMRAWIREGAILIACKESIRLLVEQGFDPHYSVSMDPGPEQVKKTFLHPSITYCIASSCHPALFDHVIAAGRPVQVFHSACGATEVRWFPGAAVAKSAEGHDLVQPGNMVVGGPAGELCCPVVPVITMQETDLYDSLFPDGQQWVACGGLTVVNRALAVARHWGCDPVSMVGCDFGYREGSPYYAAGARERAGNAGVELTDHGQVDGTPWWCRPDQLVSAASLYDDIRACRVEVVGDSLATALAKRDREFVNRAVELASL